MTIIARVLTSNNIMTNLQYNHSETIKLKTMKLELGNQFKVSRWQKNGQDRLYIKAGSQDLGYIDLVNRRNCLKTTGRDGRKADEIRQKINEWLASESEEIEQEPTGRYLQNGFYGTAADHARGYDGIE